LHYQEATFLWHRAFLRHIEELIDFPIPYWNGYALDTADPDSAHAGLPNIFLEDEYIHPIHGVMKNPLKYARSYKGRSKSGNSDYVQRDKIFVQTSQPKPPGWATKIGMFRKYQDQITHSLKQDTFSASQGYGHPWAAIPIFDEDTPDSEYLHRSDFDGLFEQVHDNFHGWVGGIGGDMVRFLSTIAQYLDAW
jgi:Common central domain of tyrosinase